MNSIVRICKITAYLSFASVFALTLMVTGAFLYLSPNLPSVDTLTEINLQKPLRVYTKDGKLIGEYGQKRRTPLKLEDAPKPFLDAVLAAEDDRFYEHHGVDIKGLLRASIQLVLKGRIQTGGSTITMQVAKNYFLSQERTFSRKFNEIFLSFQIERELDKNQILELYLNKIFLGNRAYGAAAAAKVYYGRNLQELNLAQWAMIAGLPKAPSRFNPIVNPERAITRRNWILGRMLKLGNIDEAQYSQAFNSPVTARYNRPKFELDAPYVAEMARLEMLKLFGNAAYTEGYHVYTSVDSQLQLQANESVAKGLESYDIRHGYRGAEAHFPNLDSDNSFKEVLKLLDETVPFRNMIPGVVTQVTDKNAQVQLNSEVNITLDWSHEANQWSLYRTANALGKKILNPLDVFKVGDLIRVKYQNNMWSLAQLPKAQSAFVALNSQSGAILSLVGGYNFSQSKFNRVTQAERQPGSNFKPFIYAAALNKGYTAASIFNDAPIVFNDQQLESTWRPSNSSGKFDGPMRLRKALYLSRNLVSIRLLQSVGINTAIKYISQFGFERSELPKDLSLALGSHSLTPLDVVSAYAILANGGYKVTPHLIEQVKDSQQELVYEANPSRVCHYCEKQESESSEDEKEDSVEIIAEQNTAEDQLPPTNAAPRVIDERIAYIMDSMLKDVIKRGTATKAKVLNRNDIAGKTGTTNGPIDAWFSGYGGNIVATAWLGFDQNQLLGRKEYGGSAALPIWIDFMQAALADKPSVTRPQPDGIASTRIDPETGAKANPGQRNSIFEIFRTEYLPETESNSADSNYYSNELDQIEEEIF